MVSESQILDNAVTTKHNFVSQDSEVDSQKWVFKEKMRLWNKITRIRQDSNEVAVLIPFNTFIEPFYSSDDLDLTVDNCGVLENGVFRLYSDANGNYKQLVSKVV